MPAPEPEIGDWYRMRSTGSLFEVVAADADDGTIEIQYFDGTVEEMDLEDWTTEWEDGALEAAEAPEDWTGSVDVDSDDDSPRNDANDSSAGGVRASGGYDPLDLIH